MVAAISSTTPGNTKRAPTPKRPPLLPSESDNAIAPPRRPKAREVTSRYMSPSSSTTSSSSSSVSSTPTPRRCQSPLVPRMVKSMRQTTPSKTLVNRSVSAERRRHGTGTGTGTLRGSDSVRSGAGNNGGGCDAPVAQKMLFTSTRSLSVSFQGQSFSIQVSKAKPAPSPSPSPRKGTPERRKGATTPSRGGNGNFTNLDQHRWPAKISPAICMSRSVDLTDPTVRKSYGAESVVRSPQNSTVNVRASLDGKLRSERIRDGGSELQSEHVPSDNESVTSGSSSGGGGAQELGGGGGHARFLHHEANKLRRQTDPISPTSRNGGNRATVAVPQKLLLAQKKSSFDNSPSSSPRGVVNSRGQACSPLRSAVRPASPSKLAPSTPSSTWSSSRGLSPLKLRNGVAGSLSNRFGSEPSVLSFVVDVPRGKVGENRIFDAHSLRLMYNRLMQWRFVNAKADAALSAQTSNAEKSLYDAWLATSKLRESVRAKRAELQLLKQQFKLISILKGQIPYLEDWAILDRVYSSSLSGAIEALKGSTLRLPVVGGAKADALNVKDAICSAMDVMQAMASSICLLSPKVGHVNSLVVEVSNLSAKERVLLEECKELLAMIENMQVRECSLRTHVTQMKTLR